MKIYAVIDAQNDFIDGMLGTPEAVIAAKNIEKLLRERSTADDLILFTQDTHGYDYLKTFEGKRLPVPHCIFKHCGWQVPEYLVAAADHIDGFVTKPTFGSEDLVSEIIEEIEWGGKDVDEIIFVGFCTDICVISNVLLVKAGLYDNPEQIPITVYANCCAGVTPAKHEAALEVMRSCQIDVKETF